MGRQCDMIASRQCSFEASPCWQVLPCRMGACGSRIEYGAAVAATSIEPEKYYNEARVNDADRVVHRIANDTVYFVDIVPQDAIGSYGKRR